MIAKIIDCDTIKMLIQGDDGVEGYPKGRVEGHALPLFYLGRLGMGSPAERKRVLLAQLLNVMFLSLAAFLSSSASSSLHATDSECLLFCFDFSIPLSSRFIGG